MMNSFELNKELQKCKRKLTKAEDKIETILNETKRDINSFLNWIARVGHLDKPITIGKISVQEGWIEMSFLKQLKNQTKPVFPLEKAISDSNYWGRTSINNLNLVRIPDPFGGAVRMEETDSVEIKLNFDHNKAFKFLTLKGDE